MKNKIVGRVARLLLCALLCMAVPLTGAAMAFDGSGGETAIAIRITPPRSWAEGTGAVEIRITDNAGAGFKNAQVKAGAGDWQDVTAGLERTEGRWYHVIDVTGNCTVYVRVTGMDGTVYEKSRYIQCFDPASDERPGGGDRSDIPAEDGPGVPLSPATPVIPGGQGTVIDEDTGSGREFFTISTPDEHVFYLVIDREKGGEDVYFLNTVTESDLMALAEKEGASATPPPVCSCREKCVPGAVDAGCPVCILSWRDCGGTVSTAQAEPERGGSGIGTIAVVLAAALAAGGAGYYIKIYRPRKELAGAEDLDELTGEGPAVNEDDLPAAMFDPGPDEPEYPESYGEDV